MPKHRSVFWGAIAISAILYLFLGYFVERFEHLILLTAFSALFGLMLIAFSQKDISFSEIAIAGIGLRLLLLVSIPSLSDDVFRFIWDGRLWIEGIHPFQYLPEEIMAWDTKPAGLNTELYSLLNSKDHYTIYPPIGQFIFLIAAWIAPDSILGATVVIRVFILAFELATILMLGNLIRNNILTKKSSVLYILNPLVILELTGNLHFEAAWITMVVLTIIYTTQNKPILAGISLALGIAAKLIPLMFMPLFIRYLNIRSFWIFAIVTVMVTVLLFIPLIDMSLFNGMYDSLDLYFRKFEFNASIYYLVRYIGFEVKGYNIIQTAGPALAKLVVVFVLYYTVIVDPNRVSLAQSMMWVLFVFLLLSTIIHPWYIVPVIFLSLFTKYRFPIVWSFLAFFTYMGYSQSGYHEVTWVVATEYLAVIGIAVYEIRRSGYFVELYHKIRSGTW